MSNEKVKVVIEKADVIRYVVDKLKEKSNDLKEVINKEGIKNKRIKEVADVISWDKFNGEKVQSTEKRFVPENAIDFLAGKLTGEMTAMKKMISVLEELTTDDKVLNIENVINSFYKLQKKDMWFEKKYQKIWE